MNSIIYRITGLMFLLVASTVFTLTYMANHQMKEHFEQYLRMPHAGMMGQMHMNGMMMGVPEQTFLSSIHQSLNWIGLGILVLGLFASYALARSITVPLRRLSQAVEKIEKGTYGLQVEIDSEDEVGNLAAAFNRMSRSLAEHNTQRKRLLADIAHELRTPLTVIQGNLEGMLDGVIPTSNEQLASLYEETIQLNRLIKDLRDLSLAEAGQLVLEKQPEDVNVLITRMLQVIKPLADEKQIKLEADLAPLPPVSVDISRINQVFSNLLTNALRYTPRQGYIKVTTNIVQEGEDKLARIAFLDSGCGINSADLPHIFQHFYRADKSRDRKSGGSGIGLAIVKQLVELHGGRVTAASEVGKGSVFTIDLPIN